MTEPQGPTGQDGGVPPPPPPPESSPPPPPPGSYAPPGGVAAPPDAAPPGATYKEAKAQAKAAKAYAKAQRPFYKKWWFWAIIVIVLIIIISVANSGGSSKKSTSTNGTPTTQQAAGGQPSSAAGGQTSGGQNKLTVGQTGTSGDFDITLNAVTDPYTSTNQFVQPSAGTRYVAVDVTMKNRSSDQQPVSSALNFELTDSTGQKYTETFAPGATPIDGFVPANDQRRGTMVYAVPVGVTGLELRVKGDISSGGTVFTL
jgi:Domain of unknown function (DUF4352)